MMIGGTVAENLPRLRVAVVLVNWNARRMTLDCLESIEKTGYPGLLAIVVDNGSGDGSVAAIKEAFPEVVVIENAENRLYCPAVNQGLAEARKAGCDVVLLLNNDTIVDRFFFEAAIGRLETSGDLIVTPKIYFLKQPTHFWFAVGTASLWTGLFRNRFYRVEDTGQLNAPREMDFTVGCCVLARLDVFEKIGGLDEAFLMYCDDLDWSLRARAAGRHIILEPEAKIFHHISFSGDRESVDRRYLMTRNHLWVLRRHGRWYHRLVWFPMIPLRSGWRCLKLAKSLDPAGIGAEVRGVLHGLFRRLPPKPGPISG